MWKKRIICLVFSVIFLEVTYAPGTDQMFEGKSIDEYLWIYCYGFKFQPRVVH